MPLKVLPLIRLLLPALLPLALGAQTTWTGAVDNDWFNPANWSNGLPAPGNPADIPAGSPDLVLSADLNLDFRVENHGDLDVFLQGYRLDLPDSLLNFGTLNIREPGTARLFGTFLNEGLLLIHPCATFEAHDGSTYLEGAGGSVINGGILYVLGDSDLSMDSGAGIQLSDLAEHPKPTARCRDTLFLPLLQPGNFQALTLDDVDAGSDAPYCYLTGRELSQSFFGCEDLGTSEVVLTVTDALGYRDSCTLVLVLYDTLLPQAICPDDILAEALPGDCGAVVSFAVEAEDNCPAPQIRQVDGTGLGSGSFFPLGSTELLFEVFDGWNRDTCSFTVTVEEFEPPSAGLVCNDTVNISLGPSCELALTPDMLLEGEYGCFDHFEVEIEGRGTNLLDASLIDSTVRIIVRHLESGESCWGVGRVEDKSLPRLSGCDTVLLYCFQNPLPESEGGDVPVPEVSDCSAVEWTYEDEWFPGDCASGWSAVLHRRWTAVDAGGLSATCLQVVGVRRLGLGPQPPQCPPKFVAECGEAPDPFAPPLAGYPFFDLPEGPLSLSPEVADACGLSVQFSDDTLAHCGAGLRIARTWSVLDWCLPVGPGNPWRCIQFLDLNDSTPPEFEAPADLTVSVDAGSCRATPTLPPVTFEDCSAATVSIHTPVGVIGGNGGTVPAPGLEPGEHTLTYRVTDACGNSTARNLKVTVVDAVPPVPVCDAHTLLPLPPSGMLSVPATLFDDGSHDNCCLEGFSARILGSGLPPADSVHFDCQLAGENLLELIVRDCAGNTNSCLLTVEIIPDGGAFEVVCPPDLTLSCGEDPQNLDRTGRVVLDSAVAGPQDGYVSNPCALSDLEVSFEDSLDLECGVGTVLRVWEVRTPAGNRVTCLQRITLENDEPFSEAHIQWPPDAEVAACSPPLPPDAAPAPLLQPPNACSRPGMHFQDSGPLFDSSGCPFVLRRWTVVDSCVWNPADSLSPGIWHWTQRIDLLDGQAPQFADCSDREFCNFKPDCLPLILDLSVALSDDCAAPEDLSLHWTVDAFNDGHPDAGPAFSGNGQNTQNAYPVGEHRITYTATDPCGNQSQCSFLFTIRDCKPPTLDCPAAVLLQLDSTGQATLLAEEVALADDNCTDPQNLHFSFDPGGQLTSLSFSCADLGGRPLTLWVHDEAGNPAFCDFSVQVFDDDHPCQQPLIAIGGSLRTPDGEGLSGARIELEGLGETLSAVGGVFRFDSLPPGQDYTLRPLKNDDPLNGVTTYDLVLLNRHLLGTHPLPDPYRRLAADANHSGTLTVTDLLTLRRAILLLDEHLPDNVSWRFLPADFSFPDPNDPLSLPTPQTITLPQLEHNALHTDFVAVKIGDLDGSARLQPDDETQERRHSARYLQVPDRSFLSGESLRVPFFPEAESDWLAFQMTLHFDPAVLEFAGLEESALFRLENVGLQFLDEGVLTVSWNLPEGGRLPAGEALFALEFNSLQAGTLRQALELSSQYTAALSFDGRGVEKGLGLRFIEPEGLAEPNAFQLLPNRPNPFRKETRIEFLLPRAALARVAVFDLRGRELWQTWGTFPAGKTSLPLPVERLPQTGVFLYRVETPFGSQTRKMLRR